MDNTEKKRIKILNYRTSQGIAPKPENIVHGEIAIGYKKGSEAIYIKNSTNEIVDFTPISIINITYNELKELRDNSKLKPSQYYRITDFVTTVANDPKAQSAGHPFDLIILAADKNKLQEECYAIQHEGDEYFKNCNLAAWKIWYCLDNNRTKYAWADTTNGKGVIYHMIDEWQNDCPYDFKNIMFSRTVTAGGLNIDGAYYTFSWVNEANKVEDASIVGQTLKNDEESVNGVHDNLISVSDAYHLGINNNTMAFALNGNVFVSEYTFEEGIFYGIYGNHFAINCYNNTFGNGCYNNTFGNDCYGNSFGNDCDGNSFGNGCYDNSFGNGCYNNTFGDGCFDNTFGNYYYNNTFGDNCNYNSFGNDCYDNSFGNNFYSNTFGGNYCSNNSFGNDCFQNKFGNRCISNTFGNDCYNNTFGDNCDRNTFGNQCYRNTFGGNCDRNTFGNGCGGNTFGNDCVDNSFGNYCCINTFGNYFKYNALGNDIQFIEIPTEKIYHTQILNGTQGTRNNKLTLAFTPETTYSQFAGFTSDGVLKIWAEADDIVNITYNELKELRDNSNLKPSQYYRITDFVTTVANDPEAQSAGHPFDLIILATDKNKLQEECYAIQHEGDTYFANCNLAAWKIWYCLDNDNTKYIWADTANGKGVIYRMIDEWENDCPYDFKNVQFKRYQVTVPRKEGEDSSNILLIELDKQYIGFNSNNIKGLVLPNDLNAEENYIWAYTFSFGERKNSSNGKPSAPIDGSLIAFPTSDTGKGYGYKGYFGSNVIKPTTLRINNDNEYVSKFVLNNIIFFCNNTRHHAEMMCCKIANGCFNMTLNGHDLVFGYDSSDIIMGEGCCSIIAGEAFTNNTFGNSCESNSFGDYCNDNTFGNNCNGNTFGNSCWSNSFGNNCYSNSFGNSCEWNTLRDNCYSNSFGNNCNRNTFGNSCNGNTFGNSCWSNSFGNSCASNSFENNCGSNTFGNNCNRNTFGNSCESNSFGDYCNDNTFGNNCNGNTFGEGCSSNSFGNKCNGNIFAKDSWDVGCSNNSFGHNCASNSFGYSCSDNTFGNNFYKNSFGDFFQYNTFGNDCRYNSFGLDCGCNSFGNECVSNSFGNEFYNNALGNYIQNIEIATKKIYHTQILNGTKGSTPSEKLTLAFTPETTYSQFAGFTSDGVLKIWVEADAPHDTVDCSSY